MTEGLYHKFTRERLYEQVADHIDGLISTGKLKIGDRLPPNESWPKGWVLPGEWSGKRSVS